MTSPQAPTTLDLDARYGRRPAGRRAIGIGVSAAILAVLAVVWIVWAQPWSVQEFWKSNGYRVVDDRTIAVTWSVTLGPDDHAQCAIAAQNVARAIVGWKVVGVDGTAQPTQQLSEQMRTTEPADTGLVYRCWLT